MPVLSLCTSAVDALAPPMVKRRGRLGMGCREAASSTCTAMTCELLTVRMSPAMMLWAAKAEALQSLFWALSTAQIVSWAPAVGLQLGRPQATRAAAATTRKRRVRERGCGRCDVGSIGEAPFGPWSTVRDALCLLEKSWSRRYHGERGHYSTAGCCAEAKRFTAHASLPSWPSNQRTSPLSAPRCRSHVPLRPELEAVFRRAERPARRLKMGVSAGASP